EKLDATLEVTPRPVDASVAVDGIFVGRGAYRGRMRPGKHTIRAIADGYFAAERSIDVARGADSAIAVTLERDPTAPAWRKPGRFSVEIAGAGAISPSLGGDVAECASCKAGFGLGGGVVAHGGFETWTGLSFGGTFGYLTVQQRITDRAID